MKGVKKEDTIKAQAERFLEQLKLNRQMLEAIEAQYREEVEMIKNRYYERIEAIKNDIRQTEDSLQKLALKHRHELFRGDIAELHNGRLIYQVKSSVKRVRGMLERLEQLGWTEAIIIEKKVNWDEIERWTDERLIAVGTERVIKESIQYELK